MRMYPFSSSFFTNSCTAASSVWFNGYTLQSTASGDPSLSSMAWSHALLGGYRFDSSSLNTFAYSWYSGGIVAFVTYWFAAIAKSVAVVALIVCFCIVRMYSSICVVVVVMIGSFLGIRGFTDRITTRRVSSWITA